MMIAPTTLYGMIVGFGELKIHENSMNKAQKRELPSKFPAREKKALIQRPNTVVSLDQPQETKKRPLPPAVLRAYLYIFNLISPNGFIISPLNKAKMNGSLVKSVLRLDLDQYSNLQDLLQAQHTNSAELNFASGSTFDDTLTEFNQSFELFLKSPNLNHNFRKALLFFIDTLDEGDFTSSNYPLDPRIGAVGQDVIYSQGQRRLRFSPRGYSPVFHIPSMAGSVQAVIMDSVAPLNYKGVHSPNTDVWREEFFRDYHGHAVSERIFRDPLVFIPRITGNSVGEVQQKYLLWETELKQLFGLFMETLYDFLAPIDVNFHVDERDLILNLNALLKIVLGVSPSTAFTDIQRQSEALIRGENPLVVFARSNMGVNLRFHDQKLSWNGNQEWQFQSLHPDFITVIPEKFADLLLRRFNNNFNQLRAQAAKIAEMSAQEAINTLKREKSLNPVEEAELRLQVFGSYATWIGMVLGQFSQEVVQKINLFKMGQTVELKSRLGQKR